MPRYLKRSLAPWLVCLLFAIVAIVFYVSAVPISWGGGESDFDVSGSISEKDTDEIPEVPVEVAAIRRGNLTLTASGSGIASAVQEAEISTDVGGKVVELHVEEGDHVESGELLVRLDDRVYQLALEEAESQLLNAQVKYGLSIRRTRQRDIPMYGINANSDTSTDDANRSVAGIRTGFARRELLEENQKMQTQEKYTIEQIFSGKLRDQVAAAKSGLVGSRVNVRKSTMNLQATRLRAPFSGVIADLSISVGERVSAGEAIFRLMDVSQIRLNVQVLETEFGDIRAGQSAQVRFIAYPSRNFYGHVVAVNPAIDPETKTGRVSVGIDNAGGSISVGMFAEAAIEYKVFTDRVFVPKAAVIERGGRSLLFVVRDGFAKWCYVDIGLSNLSVVELVKTSMELRVGESVITDGHFSLPHDAKVIPVGL